MATTQRDVILVQGCGRFGMSLHDRIINSMPANSRLRCGYSKDQQKCLPTLQKMGTQAINLDLDDDKSVDVCLKDVRDIVLIPPFKPNREEIVKKFIDKAVAAGVSRVILISVQGAGTGEFPWAKDMFNIEQKLKSSGMHYTILRCALHEETISYLKDDIKNGTLALPTGEAKFAPICYRDVTEWCVKLLKNPELGRNKSFELTGPNLFTGKEIAQLLTESLGRNVNFVSIGVDDFKKKLRSFGVNDVKADSIGDFLGWYAKGSGNRLFTDYSTMLEREPTPLKNYVIEHKTEFA